MQVKYRQLPTDRSFGIELEVSKTLSKKAIGDIISDYEISYGACRHVRVSTGDGYRGWEESRGNLYWHVKYDSTCGPLGKGKDHGWEIASFVANLADLEHICFVSSELAECGVVTNRNCGLHVHVNARDLTPHQIGLMLACWIKAEPYLFAICDESRKDNKYCKSLYPRALDLATYNPDNLTDFFNQMKPTNFGSHNNSQKKYTLNTQGYAIYKIHEWYDRPTVELRMPECILDQDHIGNWTKLFLNFVESCKCDLLPIPSDILPSSSVEESMKYLGLHGEDEFFLLDEDILNVKKWFLRKLSVSSKNNEEKTASEASKWLEFVSQI